VFRQVAHKKDVFFAIKKLFSKFAACQQLHVKDQYMVPGVAKYLTRLVRLALQVSYLLGIPAEELLPPSHSLPAASSPAVPRLLPWPESVPQTPELPPHPATAVEGLQASAAANRPAGNAQAQSRQPSDLILWLAAEAKAAQMQARNQAPATPEGVSLKQPLQAGFSSCS
jgi:hypothetical protein